jgi:NAD-dependent SIR2 family protein deacetylase
MADAVRPRWPPLGAAADDDGGDEGPPPPSAAAAAAAPPTSADELGRLLESRLQVNDDDVGDGPAEGDDDGPAEGAADRAGGEESESGDDDDDDVDDDDDSEAQEALLRALAGLSAGPPSVPPPLPAPSRLLPSLDLAGVASYLCSPACARVVFLVGAGASTSAGIPDFRTPGSGLYDNLQDLGLPHPEAVFDLDYFRENPRPFFTLARSLYPRRRRRPPRSGRRRDSASPAEPATKDEAASSSPSPSAGTGPRPTPAHHFFELVRRKGKLGRVFTQNIDALEHAAGLGEEEVVAAHGNFYGCACVECGREHAREVVERAIFFDEEDEEDGEDGDDVEADDAGAAAAAAAAANGGGAGGGGGARGNGEGASADKKPSFAPPRCEDPRCGGLVKPSIVFFGEGLPPRFFERRRVDLPAADLLVVVGTSLVVHPFAGLLHDVAPRVPRLLINRERVGEARPGGSRGFVFDGDAPGGGRDVLFLGDADEGVRALASLCGWGEELEAIVAAAALEDADGEEEEEEGAVAATA